MSSPLHASQVVLVCHGQTPSRIVRSIVVEPGYDAAGLRLVYRLTGTLAQLRIPSARTPAPAGRLWAHTCFEAFVAARSGSRYREWNFSPSGQSAEYVFSGYREGVLSDVAEGAIAAPAIDVQRTANGLALEARFALPPLSCMELAIGLSAVVEDADGGLSYWALRHPSAQPDFHLREGFVLSLDIATGVFSI
jgi:hypothetical protein